MGYKTAFSIRLGFSTLLASVLMLAGTSAANPVINTWSTDQKTITSPRAYLEAWRKTARVPGATLAITDGSETEAIATGNAVLSPRRKLNTKQRLRIASASKTLVAVVILQLVNEGKISLEQPINGWFPSLPNADRITVRMLLNHTSGVPDYLNSSQFEAYPDGPNHPFPHDGALGIANTSASSFEPGSRYSYSNTNYHLLGLIIENTTGVSLFENIRARLFKPLRLKSVKLDDGYGPHQTNVHGYDSDMVDQQSASYGDGSAWRTAGWADGAALMTSGELARWGHALCFNRKILPKKMRKLMFAGARKQPDANGLGIFGEEPMVKGNYTAFGHSGGDIGFESLVICYPDLGVSAGLIVNGITSENANEFAVVTRDIAEYWVYDA